jgi:hypothetical protein
MAGERHGRVWISLYSPHMRVWVRVYALAALQRSTHRITFPLLSYKNMLNWTTVRYQREREREREGEEEQAWTQSEDIKWCQCSKGAKIGVDKDTEVYVGNKAMRDIMQSNITLIGLFSVFTYILLIYIYIYIFYFYIYMFIYFYIYFIFIIYIYITIYLYLYLFIYIFIFYLYFKRHVSAHTNEPSSGWF